MIRFILPVKGFGRGKSRLNLDPARRAELTEAMLLDTLRAVLAADLGPAIVVTADPQVLELAQVHAALGFHHAGALNDAIAAAAGDNLCAAILPDLPALRPDQLRTTLSGISSGFVADWSGTGTTMLFGSALRPHFGPASAHRHELAGYPRLSAPQCGLTADVDTWADLTRAQDLGLGPMTARVVSQMARSA